MRTPGCCWPISYVQRDITGFTNVLPAPFSCTPPDWPPLFDLHAASATQRQVASAVGRARRSIMAEDPPWGASAPAYFGAPGPWQAARFLRKFMDANASS